MNSDLELAPYQKDAALWLAPQDTAMIVGDPGIGKTPIACVAAYAASPTFMERILVFCPPIAVNVWETHFRDWTDIKDIRVAGFAEARRPENFVTGYGVRIVGYSRALPQSSLVKACRSANWGVLILDEVHALKNPSADRTKAIYGLTCSRNDGVAKSAKRVWCLSGTPLLNHSAEFWTHLRALKPSVILIQGDTRPMTYDEFIGRYANRVSTPFGWRISGSKRTDELARRVKPFIRRIRLKDVIHDMPELRIVETPLPKPEGEGKGRSTFDFDGVADDALLATIAAPSNNLATHRRVLGEIKALGVAMFVQDQLEDAPDDKLLLFAHHRTVIDMLAERLRLYSPLVIHGETPNAKRVNFIHAFQTDLRYRLMILAIDAAGEAITLTAARHVVFAESSWTPARNAQAIARAYRRGQNQAVLARFMLMPDTLDERIMRVLAAKARAIAGVIDGETATSEPEPKPEPQLFPEI